MTPFRRRLRRLRRGAWLAVSAVLILAAVLVGLINLALPWLASDTARLASWIEARVGQPVHIEAAGGQWLRSGPAFRLKRLHLGGADGIEVDEAELRINVYAWLLPRRALVELRLSGLDLEVSRAEGDRWQLRGLVLPQRAPASPTVEARLPGALSIRDSRLRIRDVESGLDLELERVNLAYSRQRGDEFWNGSAWPVGGSAPLGFVIEMRAAGGRAYLLGRDLELSEWLGPTAPFGIGVREGSGDIEAWLQWHGRRLAEVRVEAQFSALALRGVEPLLLGEDLIEPRTMVSALSFGARWRALQGGWKLDLEDLQIAASGSTDIGRGLSLSRTEKSRYRLEIERIPLGPVVAMAALADVASPALRGWLYGSAASGRLEDVVVDVDQGQLRWAEGHVESLATRSHGVVPGLGPLSMQVSGDASGMVATMVDQHPMLDAPRVLAAPVLLEDLDARLGVYGSVEGISVEFADASMKIGGFGIDFDANLATGGPEGTILSAAARVGPGRIEHLHDLWPVGVMPAKTLRWLRSALISGEMAGGVAVFQGPLEAWPFEQAEGRFEALADVAGTLVEFNPGWPPLEGLDAQARFVNTSLDVEAGGARIAGNRIETGRARIDDLDNALLDIHIEGGGSGRQLLGLLRRSPLNDRFGSYLIGVDVGGRGAVNLDLHFALKEELGEDHVLGEVWLDRSDLSDVKWGLEFGAATGPVRFDQDGFSADELKVWLGPDPAHLSIAIGSRTGDPANLAEASLRGLLPLAAVTSGFSEIEPLWPRVVGRSNWTLDLAIERGEHGLDGPKRLVMHSDLVGATIDLPAPLRKAADQPLPMRMEISLPALDGRLSLSLGDLAHLSARLPGLTQSFAGAVALGVEEDPGEPPLEGLRMRGHLPELDLSGWMAFGAGAGPDGQLDVALDVERLAVFGREFEDVELVVRSVPVATEIAFNGPGVLGMIEIPAETGVRRGVTANFERLYWASAAGPGSLAGGISVDPAQVPPLHLWVGDLRLGEAELGETRLETWPSAEGMHVELFESRSPQVDVRARGDWVRGIAGDRSRFDLSFASQDLGKMLDALGYSGFVEGGQTLAQFNVAWPGTPADFGLAQLSGSLNLSIGSGRILDVEPGAGRILGLASLQAIPRRLSLDFSDLFSPGMSFNAINGSFRFSEGSAWTEDLRLDGPAAAVGIRGRTGLADRSYDQELDVFPRVGGALPVLGAIAGGPAGAAAGLVVQNVFARPLDQVARARYRVTGSWEHPEIEQVPVPRPRARESGSG